MSSEGFELDYEFLLVWQGLLPSSLVVFVGPGEVTLQRHCKGNESNFQFSLSDRIFARPKGLGPVSCGFALHTVH
jgi:hypothetical protein